MQDNAFIHICGIKGWKCAWKFKQQINWERKTKSSTMSVILHF